MYPSPAPIAQQCPHAFVAVLGPYILPGLHPRAAMALLIGHSCSSKLGTLEWCGLRPTVAHELLQHHDLMHLDLWTSPVVSVSSSKYYMVILDDFTHYLWTFPLKLKSDTFTTLSNFVAYVATQFSCTIKVIQCDNGHEFNNSSTWTFLLSKGTQLWMSCPYTSPQNGKSERIIHSINNVIHTLLI
jgi:hypothetical protein